MTIEDIHPEPKTTKRRQHVANVTLTNQQVGYAMVNNMTKEEMVQKAVEEYCAPKLNPLLTHTSGPHVALLASSEEYGQILPAK